MKKGLKLKIFAVSAVFAVVYRFFRLQSTFGLRGALANRLRIGSHAPT